MILVTGSLAFDYLMDFPGKFSNNILPEEIHNLSVSFITSNFRKYHGGTAGNIAHSIKLIGESPLLMATAGYDFEEYMTSLNWRGIPTQHITVLEDEITASAFITTDENGNQITMFHPGAMVKANKKSLDSLKDKIQLAIIAPEDKSTMLHYIGECKKNNIPYIFDPGQNLPLFTNEDLHEAIEDSKGVICNAYEWEVLMKNSSFTKENIHEDTDILIVTQGAKGADIITEDDTLYVPSVKPHEIQDPTGCGDAFRAGLLKGLLHDTPLDEAGKMGALLATYCIEEHGTQNHSFSADQFEKRLKET